MNSVFKSFNPVCESHINNFISKLSLEKFENDQLKAEETMKVLEAVLFDDEITTFKILLEALSFFGAIIQSQMPWETTPYNIIQRVIKIIKEECLSFRSGSKETTNDLLPTGNDNPAVTFEEVDFSELRTTIIEVIAEQKAELEQCQELIAIQGEAKIHSDEIIMTCGYCETVLGFLFKASKRRRFHVIVAECAPNYEGHKMAKCLASANIQTTVIQDSAIFSMMSRVNKVIIGCHTVFCNGGIKTYLGAASLGCAAKFYSVPLYVCTPTYKFSTEMMEDVKEFDSPSLIISKEEECNIDEVNVAIAKYDYVPPENVTSFITNNRGIAPSYVYRQVMELYQPSADDI